jgi:hypothetical protein
MHLALPAPLFTIDMEGAGFDRMTFTRFFDCLEPVYGHMVSLGQSNTMVLCPALTSHSEMNEQKLKQAGIMPTTIRISVGDEDVRSLIAHFIRTAELVLDKSKPGFSSQFMSLDEIDALYNHVYLSVHQWWIDSQPKMRDVLNHLT